MMALTKLEIRNLSLQRDPQLEHAELTISSLIFESGQHSMLTGPTGSGKTTLLHLLGGLLRPTTGEILANSEAVSRWTAAHRDLWRRHVGILFQHGELIDELNASENVLAPMIPRQGSLREKQHAVHHALESVGALHLHDRDARQLSGGERQRVALARAIVDAPDLLLLDEPTSHQDDERTSLILDICSKARTRGAIVITASHDPRMSRADTIDTTHELVSGRIIGS
jgi:ABC-type lipoprotein export system ATPase subunit